MMVRLLPKKNLKQFVEELAGEYAVFGPVKRNDLLLFAEVTDERLDLDAPLTDRSPKEVFFPEAETLLTYEGGRTQDASYSGKPIAVIGVRPCDARALSVLDKVFLQGPYVDPYWQARRAGALVLGVACNTPSQTCFCHWLGGGPFDEEGADVFLTDTGDAFVAQGVSENGTRYLEEREVFSQANDEDIATVSKLKQTAESRLAGAVDISGLDKALRVQWEGQFLEELASKCLGCCACAFLCPTCHCFDVEDEGGPERGRRMRIWDSCMTCFFTKEASGHNPRAARKERLRQRVMDKFRYIPENLGVYGCVGCGRCVRACPANVDVREILKAALGKELEQ